MISFWTGFFCLYPKFYISTCSTLMSHSVNKSADELVKQFWLILKCLSLDWMFFILWNDLGSMKAIYVFNSVFFRFSWCEINLSDFMIEIYWFVYHIEVIAFHENCSHLYLFYFIISLISIKIDHKHTETEWVSLITKRDSFEKCPKYWTNFKYAGRRMSRFQPCAQSNDFLCAMLNLD